MYFYSTRDKNQQRTLSQAIMQGLAPDGGLFVPEYFPQVNLDQLDPNCSYPQFAAKILADFFKGDQLETQLGSICEEAFNFPVPLVELKHNTHILELFHGPTLSFKDFGARFLAASMSRLAKTTPTTIIVATSGDTGSAVAAAFHNQPNIEVIVLFPHGQISPRQQQQITCWNDNILALAVTGSFDDCQKIVKQAFNDEWFTTRAHLSSANSINIARLLPQLTYYAYSSWNFFLSHGQVPGLIIPTGNVGNATAAFWAKAMGFPIREIALATNANQVIGDYIASGEFTPRPSITTLANAMDVGNPSNFERLRYLYPTLKQFRSNVQAFSVSDQQIKTVLHEVYQQFNYILCPHTATGYFTRQHLNNQAWIIAATADPCKFDTVLEPLIGKPVAIAPQLQELLQKPTHVLKVAANIRQVATAVATNWRPYVAAADNVD